MILNKQVTFRTVTKGVDRPSNHGKNNDVINDVQVTVNYTTVSNSKTVSVKKAIRSYGVSNPKMAKIRSITDLPPFDFIIIDNVTYELYASQSILNRRNITIVEVDA